MLERSRDENQDRALANTLCDLCVQADTVPGKQKAWLERQIGRLLETLPSELSRPIVLALLSHRRKSRQAIGLKCLSMCPIDDEAAKLILNRFRDTQNIAFLKCLLRQPAQLSVVDPYDLIGAFDDSYWKMRVVEATLKSDFKVGERFAVTHPIQFVWAVGRLNYTHAIPIISECMRVANDKVELVGIVAWAFGKLGAFEQLIELAPMLDQLDEENEAQLEAMFSSVPSQQEPIA
jgi:hypothetical protein